MTATLFRGYEYSHITVVDSICSYYSDVNLSYDGINKLTNAIANYVTNKLPNDLVWYPYTAEIVGSTDTELSEEEFAELFDELFEEALVATEPSEDELYMYTE